METTNKVTLRQWLAAANVIGVDEDIYVDGIDSIAVCTPCRLTEAGEEYFKRALDETWMDGHIVMWKYDGSEDDDEEELPDVAYLAWELLCALAGHVSVSKFEKWVVINRSLIMDYGMYT